ncbi:hypothetical protein ASF70_20380 [Rhizobium sp. Leaf321]|jgi:hypothetical protein|uniref:hypothetical protein n=1 Tax=Rhizobium sp. Leaf321 TaxID=1736335 RepID=UPI00071612DC|nr:hypothetical protein [Rhizobium sp. Leaf321]KQQ71166.1 hypothetical protein ASF70_20380 [Rhizobium sp. Leaf321]
MPQPEVEEKEEPLDPAMERIRRKMVLLQLVSGGILFVCFMAVLAAIVYKISQRPADGPATVATSGSFTVPSDQPLKATAALPTGFAIDNVSMSGSQLVFLGQLNGARKVFVFDIVLGRIVADVTIATGP